MGLHSEWVRPTLNQVTYMAEGLTRVIRCLAQRSVVVLLSLFHFDGLMRHSVMPVITECLSDPEPAKLQHLNVVHVWMPVVCVFVCHTECVRSALGLPSKVSGWQNETCNMAPAQLQRECHGCNPCGMYLLITEWNHRRRGYFFPHCTRSVWSVWCDTTVSPALFA